MKQQQNDSALDAIKAVAAASQTPFKTAFKITMGVALAQLTIAFLFFGGLLFAGTITVLLYRMGQ